MSKKIECILGQIKALEDKETIRISLDFIGVQNVNRVLEILKMRKALGEKVTIWDAWGVYFLIVRENKRRK